MKKKIIVLSMAAVMCSAALLAGCGEEPAPQSSAVETPNTPQSSAPETKQSGKGDLGEYNVEIQGVRLTKNSDDEPIAIVKYKFTNVSNEEGASFSEAIRTEAFQDGVELTSIYLVMSSDYNGENLSKKIKKGASIEVEDCYKLDNTTSDIEVEVFRNSIYIKDQNERITATLSLPQE